MVLTEGGRSVELPSDGVLAVEAESPAHAFRPFQELLRHRGSLFLAPAGCGKPFSLGPLQTLSWADPSI